MLLLLYALASWASPRLVEVPEVDVCEAVRGPLVDQVVRTVLSERYPYRPSPPEPPVEELAWAPTPWAPMTASVRTARAPERVPGPIRGPHLDAPSGVVSDGRRVFVYDPSAQAVEVLTARTPHRRLARLDGAAAWAAGGTGPLWLSPRGFLLVVSGVADTTGPAPARSGRNRFGSPAGHTLVATRVTAWDVRGALRRQPSWTLDVEGVVTGLFEHEDHVTLVTSAVPAPANELWRVAHELDAGMPAPVPGPGVNPSPDAMAAYDDVRAVAEARLRDVLGEVPEAELMAPRGRYRMDGAPWVTLAPTCAALDRGHGGAGVFVQLATLDPADPGTLSVSVQALSGTMAHKTLADAHGGELWLAGTPRSEAHTDLHRLQRTADGWSWESARVEGPAPQRFLAGPGRLAAVQRVAFDRYDERGLLLRSTPSGLRATSLGERAPGTLATWEGDRLVLAEGASVSVLDVDGRVVERLRGREWTLGRSVPLAGGRLVSASRVVSTEATSEVGPGFSMLEHTLLLLRGGERTAHTVLPGQFYDRMPELELWRDPETERVWVAAREGAWWCTEAGCTPAEEDLDVLVGGTALTRPR